MGLKKYNVNEIINITLHMTVFNLYHIYLLNSKYLFLSSFFCVFPFKYNNIKQLSYRYNKIIKITILFLFIFLLFLNSTNPTLFVLVERKPTLNALKTVNLTWLR